MFEEAIQNLFFLQCAYFLSGKRHRTIVETTSGLNYA